MQVVGCFARTKGVNIIYHGHRFPYWENLKDGPEMKTQFMNNWGWGSAMHELKPPSPPPQAHTQMGVKGFLLHKTEPIKKKSKIHCFTLKQVRLSKYAYMSFTL